MNMNEMIGLLGTLRRCYILKNELARVPPQILGSAMKSYEASVRGTYDGMLRWPDDLVSIILHVTSEAQTEVHAIHPTSKPLAIVQFRMLYFLRRTEPIELPQVHHHEPTISQYDLTLLSDSPCQVKPAISIHSELPYSRYYVPFALKLVKPSKLYENREVEDCSSLSALLMNLGYRDAPAPPLRNHSGTGRIPSDTIDVQCKLARRRLAKTVQDRRWWQYWFHYISRSI